MRIGSQRTITGLSGSEASAADDAGADLLLVDGEANAAVAAELIRSVKRMQPRTRAMMLVGEPTRENVHAAFGAGASGVVSKTQSGRSC
jgi:DNA-binding NarL/FixJ family response regulator